MQLLTPLLRDESGGPLVEATVLIPILFVFILGAVDFLYAFSQWTAAAKAVEVGARLAAVSDPVASGLINMSSAQQTGLTTGSAVPPFQITCTSGGCSVGSYSATAMNTILYGRGSASCTDATSYYNAGMCDIFPRITAANVQIVYSQTGLGYVDRPDGPVPTITVSLQNMTYQFFFLNGLLSGFATMNLPPFTTTFTGEALSSAAVQ
jgi:Flp pilus assembly protein TadG